MQILIYNNNPNDFNLLFRMYLAKDWKIIPHTQIAQWTNVATSSAITGTPYFGGSEARQSSIVAENGYFAVSLEKENSIMDDLDWKLCDNNYIWTTYCANLTKQIKEREYCYSTRQEYCYNKTVPLSHDEKYKIWKKQIEIFTKEFLQHQRGI